MCGESKVPEVINLLRERAAYKLHHVYALNTFNPRNFTKIIA